VKVTRSPTWAERGERARESQRETRRIAHVECAKRMSFSTIKLTSPERGKGSSNGLEESKRELSKMSKSPEGKRRKNEEAGIVEASRKICGDKKKKKELGR